MSVSTLRPSCLRVTHSLWRGDLAMRSRAHGCDHSCAVADCAANAIAIQVKIIDAERFMVHLIVELRKKYYWRWPVAARDFPCWVRTARLKESRRWKLFWRVEKVVCGIRNSNFLIDVIGIATIGRSFAAFGVDALNGGSARENAGAGVADNFEQQPADGFGVGRIRVDNKLAGNAAAVVGLPRRSSQMLAEWLLLDVEKLSVGGFQSPVELSTFTLAGVNLVTLSVQLKNEFFVDWRLQGRRDFLLL